MIFTSTSEECPFRAATHAESELPCRWAASRWSSDASRRGVRRSLGRFLGGFETGRATRGTSALPTRRLRRWKLLLVGFWVPGGAIHRHPGHVAGVPLRPRHSESAGVWRGF